MIKYILLDLDETILDFKKAEKVALKATLEEFGIEPKEEILSLYSEINAAQWKRLELGELTTEQVKIKRYEILFERLQIKDMDPVKAANCYEEHLGEGHDYLPGAEAFLKKLCAKYAVYIASNGLTKVQTRRLQESGIDKLVQGSFLSQEIGAHKPNKAFFDTCFDRISGANCENTVMIGDSLTSDIKGGNQSRIPTIWYNPSEKENTSDIYPTWTCSSYEQILSQLGSERRKAPVAIEPCKDYQEETIRESLETLLQAVGGLDDVKPGMKVGIKVNLVTMMKPEAAGTTHPSLVKVLADMLVEKGAVVTIGDSPGGPYTSVYLKKVYQVTGMQGIVTERILVNDNYGEEEVFFEDAKVAKTFTMTSWLKEQDLIINFCKLKTHGMMGMSSAVKNLFGIIPGTMKPEYHFRYPKPELFADMLVDLNEYLKPMLHIVDAVVGMEGNGPTAGTPRQIGVLLASQSPYPLDMVCAQLIGLRKEDVLTLEQAYQRGLGPASFEEVNVIGTVAPYIVADYQVLGTRHGLQFQGEGLFGKIKGFVVEKSMCSRPQVQKKECIGCKKCFDICPAKAITMVEGYPVIDKDKCIHCFCCQEFCPKGAMKVHRPMMAKILQKI